MGNRFGKSPKFDKQFMETEKVFDIHLGPPGSYKVRATCNYQATGKINDISFQKNEVMHVIWKYNDMWLEVIKEKGHIQGLVPSKLVIRQNASPQSMEGWRDVPRSQAKYLLLNPDLKRGTYILRPSSKKNCYALSIRDYDKRKSDYVVKNFLIRTIQNKDGEEYSTHIRLYPNIETLINYFKIHGIGTNHTKLTEPVPEFFQSLPRVRYNSLNHQKIEFLSEIYVQNFDLDSLEKPEIKCVEKTKKKPSQITNYIFIVRLKCKSNCRKISEVFQQCTKSQNTK